MKTLKDLYVENLNMPVSKRMRANFDRKGMIYMGKYFEGVSSEGFDCLYLLNNLLRNEGICRGEIPQHRNVPVEDGTLIIVHVKETTKLCEALKKIGFEE